MADSKSCSLAKAELEAAMKLSEAKKKQEKEWAAQYREDELFAAQFHRFWNKLFARRGATFHQITSIPAMHCTYPDPDDSPAWAMETLQFISSKLASINEECLSWPLQVYGMVAARDVLDHKRNLVFHRPRNNCQTITREDPYIELTGPSRAVAVSVDPSYIEVSLKVKGATKSEDNDLSELVAKYRSGWVLDGDFTSRLSTLQFKVGHIRRSVEATVFVTATVGSWPEGFRGVFTAGTNGNDDLEVKILDTGDDPLPVDAHGAIKLTRRVVSVELAEKLKVSVVAYPVSKEQAVESSQAILMPERDGESPPGIELNIGTLVVWKLGPVSFIYIGELSLSRKAGANNRRH